MGERDMEGDSEGISGDMNKTYGDIEALITALARAFDLFEGIQRRMLKALETGSMEEIFGGMPRWTNERAAAFAMLKGRLRDLNAFLEENPQAVAMGRIWRQRLADLLEREGRIYERMSAVKEMLQEEMGTVGRGREAMEGYGMGRAQGPRFVSGSA